MNPAKIIIKKFAFEEILRSVFEALNVECIGSLFGERLERRNELVWVVESAHPIQLTKRFPNSADPEEGSTRADWSLLNGHIGDYHLHTTSRIQEKGVRFIDPGRVYLSKTDRSNLKESDGAIEVVSALRRIARKRRLEENPYLVSGYLEDEGRIYKVDVGGYYHNGRVRRALIEVPRKILGMIR